MKKILDIEPWGIELYEIEETPNNPKAYRFDYGDTYSPAWHSVIYETLDEALGDITNYILNPENVYSMEDQPEDLQKAYQLAGVPSEQRAIHPEITDSVGTFLYYVLDGIVKTNMKGEN